MVLPEILVHRVLQLKLTPRLQTLAWLIELELSVVGATTALFNEGRFCSFQFEVHCLLE